jgi:NADH dehydrogenase FAD-containing subunit
MAFMMDEVQRKRGYEPEITIVQNDIELCSVNAQMNDEIMSECAKRGIKVMRNTRVLEINKEGTRFLVENNETGEK